MLSVEQLNLQLMLGLDCDAPYNELAKASHPESSPAMSNPCSQSSDTAAPFGLTSQWIGLQQLLLQQCLQQQNQQAAAQATEGNRALASYLLSMAQSANPATSAPLQNPLYWLQQQQQQAAVNMLSQGGLAVQQQAAGMHPACSQAALSSPLCAAATWQQQQHYPATSLGMAMNSSMGMSATEAQVQLLLHGCQLPMGSFLEAPQQQFAALNAAAYGVTNINSSNTAAAAAALNALNRQQQRRRSSHQLDASKLEPSLIGFSLEDIPPTAAPVAPSSFSSDFSTSRQSSLDRRSSSSCSSGGNSPQSKVSDWGLNVRGFNINLGSSSSSCSMSSQFNPATVAAVASVDDDDIDDPPGLQCNYLCKQEVTPALDAAVTVLLNALRNLQYNGDNDIPQQQQQRRMYVCGLRESCKAIRTGRAKAVLLAPDIQLQNKFGKPDRVLNGRMNEVIQSSIKPLNGSAPVPVVFALSRKKIGQVFGSKKRMSAIALLDVRGVEDVFDLVLQLAQEGRQRWNEGGINSSMQGIHL